MAETIEGVITKVEREVGSEWGTIYTDHDRVKKLTTKIGEKIDEAARYRQSGARVSIEYNERTKTVQTDSGPRTYRNYYYEQATAIGSNGASADGIDVVERRSSPEDPLRAWRICLQSGGKLAVATLPMMGEGQRDFETQKTIARAWAEFFFFSTPPQGDPLVPAQRSQHGAYSEPEGIEQPPPLDPKDEFGF